jgi:large subunit ribosomal protein L7/L12
MTTNEIKDELVKLRDRTELDSIATFCVSLKSTLKYAELLSSEYDITLTRKVIKEEDLPAVDNPTFREEWAVRFVKFTDGMIIPTLKVIRGATGLGLKEAKDLVEAVPSTIKTFATEKEARNFEEQWFGSSTFLITLVKKI